MNLTVILFQLATDFIPRLPYRVVEAMSLLIGWVTWGANRRGRRAVRANLQTVLNREPTYAEVRAVFTTAVLNYCDLFYLPRVDANDLQSRVEVEGWDYLQDALGLGRGAIVASLHLGNLEVVGYAATHRGLRVMLPVERVNPPELLELMQAARREAGLVLEPVGTAAFDRIREFLGHNSIVGIGADRITLGTGEVVPFCGRPARMPVAAALVALRTGAPLLPIGVTRLPHRQFRLRIGRPIDVARSSTVREDARLITTRLLEELATHLRENPFQWVIFRPIWDADDQASTP